MSSPLPAPSAKVRASKYRNIYGEQPQPRECINSAVIGSLQSDANIIKASMNYVGYPGGNGFVIVSRTMTGAIDTNVPVYGIDDNGTNEFSINKFNDSVVASAHNDGLIALWNVGTHNAPASTLKGHDKRGLSVDWHPFVENLLVTADAGKIVKLWDAAAGSCLQTLPSVFGGQISSFEWDGEGKLLAVASKDKKIRVFDPRANSVVSEGDAHKLGSKAVYLAWLRQNNRLVSVGSSGAGSEWAIYDPRKVGTVLSSDKIQTGSGSVFPFADESHPVVYMAAKGDGNINIFEFADDKLIPQVVHKTKEAQTGIAMLPKTIVTTTKCEIARFVKICFDGGKIIPISVMIPRTDPTIWHEDVFPDCYDGKPCTNAASWFSGTDVDMKSHMISLKPK